MAFSPRLKPVRSTKSRLNLRWEISGSLILKAIGLAALYFLFFMPTQHPIMSDQGVASHLFSSAASSPTHNLGGGSND